MAGGVVANSLNTDFGVFQNNNAYLGMAKAWVQFVGSSATINGSFNVSSITRSGTGLYTVNFTTAMPNANYAAVISNSSASGSSQTNSQVFSSSGATFCWRHIINLSTRSNFFLFTLIILHRRQN